MSPEACGLGLYSSLSLHVPSHVLYIYINAFFATFKFVGIWCAQQRTMTPCRSKTSSSLASASGPTPTPPPRPSTKANQSKRTPNESEQEVIKKAKATACKSPATITKEHPTPKQIQFPCKHEFPLPQASPIQPPTTPPTSKAPAMEISPLPTAKHCPVQPPLAIHPPTSPPPKAFDKAVKMEPEPSEQVDTASTSKADHQAKEGAHTNPYALQPLKQASEHEAKTPLQDPVTAHGLGGEMGAPKEGAAEQHGSTAAATVAKVQTKQEVQEALPKAGESMLPKSQPATAVPKRTALPPAQPPAGMPRIDVAADATC